MLARFLIGTSGAAARNLTICAVPSSSTLADEAVYAISAAAVAAINTCALVDVVRAVCAVPSSSTLADEAVYDIFAAAVAAINTCALVDVVRAVISIPTIFANAIAIAVLTIATILAGS